MTEDGGRYGPPKRSVVLIVLNSVHKTIEKLHEVGTFLREVRDK